MAIRAFFLACVAMIGCTVQAESQPLDWTIGMGIRHASESYLNGEGNPMPPTAELRPFFEVSVGPLTLSPEKASLQVWNWPLPAIDRHGQSNTDAENGRWALAIDLQADFGINDRDQGADTIFFGMDQRSGQRFLGFNLKWLTPIGLMNGGLGRTVGGDVSGSVASLSWGLPLKINDDAVVFFDVGVDWESSDLVRYQYGVRQHEIRPDRPSWQPGAATVPRAGLAAEFAIRPHWTLLGIVDVSARADEMRHSPLTGSDRTDYKVLVGVTYTSD